jgi:hypothetical protein
MTPWDREFHVSGSGNRQIEYRKKLDIDTYRSRLSSYEKQLSFPVIDIKDKKLDNFILESIQNAFS